MQRQPASPDGQFGEAIKFFRPQVACTVQRVWVRGSSEHSVNLELAPVVESGADWEHKITVQVSTTELPKFCSCLLRIIPQVEYKYHGTDRNKSYSLQWQSGGVLRLDLSAPKKRLFIAITGEEVFWLSDLVLDQLHRNTSNMSKTDLINLLNRSFKGAG
jgi:hypothetical protein|tara:strand:+ start:182 stop:661 length:480 start_codon:yes stop_codon:yes gene_type:complete